MLYIPIDGYLEGLSMCVFISIMSKLTAVLACYEHENYVFNFTFFERQYLS